MRLPRFECLDPGTVQEACSLLADHKTQASAIAGGTDLLVKMKFRELKPKYIVRLNLIPGLNAIESDNDGLKIGAMATLFDLQKSPLITKHCDILSQAVNQMASPQIRTLATVGGNICNAAPSADTISPLIAMGAMIKVVGPKGERVLPLEEFFTGPEQTNLADGEILTEIRVPKLPPYSGGAYVKQTVRQAMDLAITGVAVVVTLESASSKKCNEVKIALGASAPTPIRARAAEKVLKGNVINEGSIEQAAQAAMDESRPRSSIRASAEYRKKMVKVLVRRALQQAVAKAESSKT
jgi:CO/xanthine dehydrogenase FAD-binding subunit